MSKALTFEISQAREMAMRLRLKAQVMIMSLRKPASIRLLSAIIDIGARKMKGRLAKASRTKKRG